MCLLTPLEHLLLLLLLLLLCLIVVDGSPVKYPLILLILLFKVVGLIVTFMVEGTTRVHELLQVVDHLAVVFLLLLLVRLLWYH